MFRDSKMQYRTPLEKHIRATGIPDIYRTLHSFCPCKKFLTSNKEITICITSIPTLSSSSSSSTTAAAAHTSLEPHHLANYLTISSSVNNKTEPHNHKAVVETNPIDDAPKPALLWMMCPTTGNLPTLLAKMRFSFAFTTSLDEDVTKSHPWHQNGKYNRLYMYIYIDPLRSFPVYLEGSCHPTVWILLISGGAWHD